MYKYLLIILVFIGYLSAADNNSVNQQQNYVTSCKQFLTYRIPSHLNTAEMADYLKELETASACIELLKFEHCARAENSSSNSCANYTIDDNNSDQKEGFIRRISKMAASRGHNMSRLRDALNTIKSLNNSSQGYDSTFEYLRSLRTNKPRVKQTE